MSKEERKAISEIRTWGNKLVRLQDKGARFVVIDRSEYCDKILDNMKSGGHHKITSNDPTQEHVRCVLNWAKKWEKADQIGEDVVMFACLRNAKSGSITGLTKSHKESYPLRVVMLLLLAIGNLSAFTEYYLSPLARQHPAYIKDTTHLVTNLQKIKEERVFPLEHY